MAKQRDENQVSSLRRAKHGWIGTILFSVLSAAWLYPVYLVGINAFKKKAFITREPFRLPDRFSGSAIS